MQACRPAHVAAPLQAFAFAPFRVFTVTQPAARTARASAARAAQSLQRGPQTCPSPTTNPVSPVSRPPPFIAPRSSSSSSSSSSSFSPFFPSSPLSSSSSFFYSSSSLFFSAPAAPDPSSPAPSARPLAIMSATQPAGAGDAPAQRRVLVAVADGSEEIETATVADVLVRAGAAVTLAAAGPSVRVRLSRGLVLEADALLADVCGGRARAAYDLVVLPGGMPGATNLRDCAPLAKLLRAAAADPDGPIIGAICAAPAVVLAHHGLLGTRDATCYPAPKFVQMLDHVTDGDVVVSADRRFVTSRGPATAMAFSLALVERLYNKELAEKLAAELLVTA